MTLASKAEVEQWVGHCVTFRIAQLDLEPVKGNFDIAHLKEIHHRIFQDMPELAKEYPGVGLEEITPGEFRPETPKHQDWVKFRQLESVPVTSHVAYSSMDKKAQEEMQNILKKASPANLSKLDVPSFTTEISATYASLDYIHPFNDGNSRTLREFTKQLAKQAGYNIDWESFNKEPAGRDHLYIARDLSVNNIALPRMKDTGAKRYIAYSLEQLGNNKDLRELMKDAVSPLKSKHKDIQHIAHEKLFKEHIANLPPDKQEQALEHFNKQYLERSKHKEPAQVAMLADKEKVPEQESDQSADRPDLDSGKGRER